MHDITSVKAFMDSVLTAGIFEYMVIFFAFLSVSAFTSSMRKAVKIKGQLTTTESYDKEELKKFYPGVIGPIIQNALIAGVIGALIGLIVWALLSSPA